MQRAKRQLMTRRSSWIIILILVVMPCASIVAAPCSTNASSEWAVSDTASAMALAAAINCSGGVFNVEWTGNIVVEHEIYLAGGTSLHVAGSGLDAGIEGSGDSRLFTVENAYLNVSHMTFSNGNAAYGGAIASNGSSLSFYQTSFIGNVAIEGGGGAIHIVNSSTVLWGGLTKFVENAASGGGGGAAFVGDNSVVSWGGNTLFSNNFAEKGGAVHVENNSRVSWEAETSFSGNTANSMGGALEVYNGSSVSWEAATLFSGNNAKWGGGVHVQFNSDVFWDAETLFSGNDASESGAGLDVYQGSKAWWKAATRFVGNSARSHGGAMHINAKSVVSWDAATIFDGNTAGIYAGGAICVADASNASWTGETWFLNNSANYGGALIAVNDASVYWEAATSFIKNSANTSGGAINIHIGSTVSWQGLTNFSNNSAAFHGGGAVYALNRSGVSWEAKTSFVGNTAEQAGGAVLVEYGSSVSWRANTSFRNNFARVSGGAVSLSSSNENSEDILSSIAITGSTIFEENRCRTNGGAMAIIGVISARFSAGTMTFVGNSAEISGGAVFVAGSAVGPRFTGVTFISNSAGAGGAVFVTGSGTAVTKYKFLNPTTFDQCRFYHNAVSISGGAVDSGAGHDNFTNTLFVGNVAQTGGALSLAGTASLYNCKFLDNISAENKGPAISNRGSIANIKNASFADNLFDCEPGMFLGYSESGKFFETVCDGCGGRGIPHTECPFDADNDKTPLCIEQLKNTYSEGGTDTLQMLSIRRGYWRATTNSTDVRSCHNADACLGGLTGSSTYCRKGYGGPYCSICKKNFTSGPGYTCRDCSDTTNGVVVAAILGVLAVGVFATFLLHMVSTESEDADRGVVARVVRVIPLQSVKIVIVAWQILTQFSEIANVSYPGVYQEFLDGVDVLNFDLSWILSTGCIFEVDFHDRLIMSTTGPLVGMAILGATYLVGGRGRNGASDAVGKFRRKHLSMVIFFTFMIYSSVSSTLFQMFACDNVDGDKIYLRADYRIECDSSRHEAFQIYAGFMIIVYTVGIPVFYAILLFRNRDVLMTKVGRESDVRIRSTTSLWTPYQPHRFYYELIECGRRISLAGVVVFIYPNTSAQIAVTIVLTVFFIFVSEALAPYASVWDTWVSRTGHAIIFLSMYVGLLLKVDVSTDDATSQRLFEVFLVFVNAFMICVVLAEAVAVSVSLRNEGREPFTSAIDGNRGRGVTSFLEEEAPF